MSRYTVVMEETLISPEAREAPAQGDMYALPATQGQVRFWSLDQLNPGNPALNMPLMWRFTGPLDRAALAAAFEDCLARHESLRTTFELIDGRLSQIVATPHRVRIPLVELTAPTAEAQWMEADRLAREHAAFRFDLKQGPLLELKLLRFQTDGYEPLHLLLVSMHHIICDGISNGILLRDLAEFYKERVAKTPAILPELPIQFADFAVWQQEWLESEQAERSLAFWRASLGRDFDQIRLARDRDASSTMPARLGAWTGNIETLLVPPDLQARAHAFCRHENVTLNILLFSVFAALLHRLTGQNDLTIGSPCANRNEDTAELIGLFMNIQVMRLQLEDDTSFRALLGKVQDWTLGAYENQELPFENLVHDSYFANGQNAFQIPVFFLYQKSFMLTHRIGELEIVPLRSESPGAVFEMMFAIVDRAEEGPRLQLEYDPRHFKVATIERFLRMFVSLLDAALAAPEARVDELALLHPDERAEATLAADTQTVHFAPYEAVTSTFLRRAAEQPDAVALECDGVCWSNARLAGYASELANRLRQEGLQPGGLVGLAVDRSPEMLGAVLAVMLAGGAYVPLDPRQPRARLETVLADCGAGLLVANRDLELDAAAKVVRLEGGSAEERSPGLKPREAPGSEVSGLKPGPISEAMAAPAGLIPGPVSEVTAAPAAGSLAYVIYTSGSTGKPKGVAIEHGALVNLLRAMEREPGLGPSDVLVAITTLAFDIAQMELLLPLLTGAKLVIATDRSLRDGHALCELLEHSGATVLQATPGAWRMLIDSGWNGQHTLKALCGGESLPRELAGRLLDRTAELWNMYGPTETTIWSSATRVVRGEGPLRLGAPIANTQFYVLDALRQPLPVGIVGELFIGGEGVARGYWDQPELTAERFAANPFAAGRMYASGDLARRHDDGTIELLGRADFQVKVRGYRIELAEIEAALSEHPSVREAVVTASVSAAAGITRLIGYVAADAPPEGLTEQLRAALARKLPDYMVPAALVVLPALPRNQNGKIDRAALPPVRAWGDSGMHAVAAPAEHYYPPMDAIERQLADIWQTTLGISNISVRSSFFSLGVGSLAALRLITKMNRVYAMDLGLASLISASTIQSVAELIRTRFAPNTTSSLVPLQPKGTQPPLYILHGVGGNVVNFYGLAMRMGRDQPVYGVQSQALVARQPALLRLKDMAAHYLRDIRAVQPEGPYHLLGYSFGGTVALEMAHQLQAAGEHVALLGMIDAKSKDYAETLARMSSVQARVGKRMTRFKGNTGALGWAERAAYVREKLSTRAIRFACMAAARIHLKQVPAFMRSAYDINYVAVQNYQPQPYAGRLILFRATEQDGGNAPPDLGWGSLFAGGVEIHDLPGDHERIFLEPNIDQLSASLRACLERV